ncbi:DUF305 domain-containing protein [Winogradskya humida]|uniref:DUF305 domain-containing protein n=1 Tax=Winogradskya humida TaxID=113566 RepID=A0ABQ3ZWQ0_9ACTN|nr:DUF305 domain-containing protein [Actinoplanes humidus]GIE22999.1 DUF305 domain-containing protein [Actinoplanes humidus]
MVLRRLAVALVLALTGLAVSFVNATPENKPASASVVAPSGADVHFAQMMVDHHEQAVRMSRALIAKPQVPERIRLIADFVAHDQQREIDETNAWLSAWGAPPPSPGPGHGMLTEAQLTSLDQASTADAPAIFLRLMIEHHEGAITMSRSLLDGPTGNVYVHGLAKHVINEQTAEIDAMRALLPRT